LGVGPPPPAAGAAEPWMAVAGDGEGRSVDCIPETICMYTQ
jgi:hypothetical protein